MTTLIPKFDLKDGGATPTGAINRPINEKLSEAVSVMDFGAVGDGATDDTTAIQNAIKALGTTGGTITFENGKTYLISAPLLLPTKIILNGNNCRLTGNGTKSVDAIHTAYYVDGVLTDLIPLPAGTFFLQQTHITNIRFTNFDTAIYAKGMTHGCQISFCVINSCNRAIFVSEGYFLAINNIVADQMTAGYKAFSFGPLNGMLDLNTISALNCDIAYYFYSDCQATSIKSLDAEFCNTAIQFQGAISGVEISGCYFENIVNYALDFGTNAAPVSDSIIHSNFFNNVGTGVYLAGSNSRNLKVYNNSWNGTIGKQVDFGSTVGASQSIVDNGISSYSNLVTNFPPAGTTNGAVLTQYSQNSSTPWNFITKIINCFRVYSGTLLVRALDYQGTITPFNYYGNIGTIESTQIPFCKTEAVNIVGAAFDIKLTTAITYSAFVTGIFCLTFIDNVKTYNLNGRFYGSTVVLDTASGKTCVASNVSGVLVLTFSGFSHPTNFFVPTGIVKMI